MEQRVAIPGSETTHSGGGSWFSVNADRKVCPTIVIRRPRRAGDLSQELLSGSARAMSREEAEKLLRADPEDLAAVRKFVHYHGLTILSESAEARTLRAEGSVVQVGQAFGVEIQERVDEHGEEYLSYQGMLTVPSSLAGVVEAVLGLDQRPLARRAAGQ